MTRRPRDRRLLTLGVAFALAWIGIGVRLVFVQGFDAQAFADRGENQRIKNEALEAPRGTIYDRHGVELAVSIQARTMVADPSQVEDAHGVAKILAPVVGVDRKWLQERLETPESQFQYVARRLEPDHAQRIEDVLTQLEITGFRFLDEEKRVYPSGSLASQIVGFVRSDDSVGLEGMEFQYDAALAGKTGSQIVERDPYGNPIPFGELTIEPPVPGSDVVLTIDRGIQFETERLLKAKVKESKAVGGTAIVLDTQTGEILAMASYPTFDANDRGAYDPTLYRNRAVADVYEPGSTLKVVTVAAALDEGLVTPERTFKVPAELDIHDKTYTDVGREKRKKMTVAEIVAESSNIGTILIQSAVGNETHHRYLSSFGLGNSVSGEFPGEAPGLLQPPGQWCETTCGPSTAIGYRVGVTPLQMAAVFAAIANDGVWLEPHIVREVVAADGTSEAYEPVRRPVLSTETAATMRMLLQGVVEDGTGQRAAVDGYTVAGKTGTTEKFIEGVGYSEEDRIASFIGMAPASAPRIVVAVVLDSPHGELEENVEYKFGGVSAAPLFAEIAAAALHQLGVEPDAS